jgi:hypothetical protein
MISQLGALTGASEKAIEIKARFNPAWIRQERYHGRQ